MLRLALVLACLAAPASATTVPDALALASAERQRAGLAPLRYDPRLGRAALTQADYMRRRGRMSHTGPNGSSVADRARSAGYRMCHGAENVADGWRSPQSVNRAWMDSPAHRRNILNPRVTEGAVAAVADANGRLFWVMVLGSRC